MKRTKMRIWLFIQLKCFLFGLLVDSSALPSAGHPVFITSAVGRQAVLPCRWKSSSEERASTRCHVQWDTPSMTIFERWGSSDWQAAEYKDRAEVPEDKLDAGDCSLTIQDVQIRDTGRYESFMVTDGERAQNLRVFIQSVNLLVRDHKTQRSHHPGEDLVLELHTPHSFRVVFQSSRNGSDWTDMWMRGENNNNKRLQKHPEREEIKLMNLRSSDEGIYKVIDEQGLSISTVQLSVQPPKENVVAPRIQQHKVATDAAGKSSCSAFLLLSALLLSFY